MAQKLLMLALSPTMSKGLIARWLKNEGDSVASGDILCEVETDKATMDYESTASGVLLKIILPEGSTAAVGDLIGIIGQAGEDISSLLTEDVAETTQQIVVATQPAADQPETKPPAASSAASYSIAPVESTRLIRSSPLARALAEQNGLDLASIQGSGPAGRIVKKDIEQALSANRAGPAAAPDTVQLAAAGVPSTAAQDTILPISGKRRVIASRLSESMFTAPHYYLKVQVEVDQLLEARQSHNARADAKISLNAYLIRLTAEALKRHPAINASWTGDSIIQYGHVDIGIAVALPDGLITPIIRDSPAKGILQIDRELKELVEKAHSQTLTPDEYTGATFTISNLGSYGIEEFTAIINPPGSAILAVGEIRKIPVVTADETIQIRSVMTLTLSCDHRVIDGAVGAEFLSDLKSLLQEPIRALY